MSGNRLILHVGAPKCASSSLQIALSCRPNFVSRSGEPFQYATITDEGRIMSGEALRQFAASVVCRYAVSADSDKIARLDEPAIAGIAQQLSEMLRYNSVILSCESWIGTAETFNDINLFGRIPFDSEIVAFVRPQAEFLNACWWQWSAWTDIDFEAWLYFSGFGNTCAWARFVQSWSAVSGVTSINTRLLSKDAVADFFDDLDCDTYECERSNRSLPDVALRFLQRNRELRPGMDDSEIDFILEKALGDRQASVPWVLPLCYVTAFIEHCRSENESLANLLSATDRSVMLTDPRWWDASFYRDRPVVSPWAIEPDAQEMEIFAVALAKALQYAERELSILRSEKL